MILVKRYIVAQHFIGLPLPDDIVLVEDVLPAIKENEFLAQAIYLCIDPSYVSAKPSEPEYQSIVGQPFQGRQIAEIIESKVKAFPVGKYVLANFPWRTYTIYNTTKANEDPHMIHPKILPDFQGLPLSLGLGLLGLPGQSAYFGLLEICQPKPGETVLVSNAASLTGSHAGQIAKVKGCYVIGFVRDEEQGQFITKELGFDHYVNIKKCNYFKKLEHLAINGIDCYFDSIGGDVSTSVMSLMNEFGRIAVCPSITFYNEELCNLPRVKSIQHYVWSKQLKMEGFKVYRWDSRSTECIQQNIKWIKEGKIKYQETIIEGFENIFVALVHTLNASTIGKALIKV